MGRHRGLAYVQPPDSPRRPHGQGDVGLMIVRGLVSPQCPLGDGEAGEHLLGAFDHEAVPLEFRRDGAHQRVVPRLGDGQHPGQGRQPSQIGGQGGEVRTGDDAGETDTGAAGLPEGLDHLAQFGDARVDPIAALQDRVGHAFQSRHKDRPVCRLTGAHDLHG